MKKLLLVLKTRFKKEDSWYLLGCLLLALFAIIRAWNLSSPQFPVFDEVHFPYFAQRYLAGEPFFDIHPPVAKWLIALSEWLFGYNTAADYSLASVGAGATDYFTRIIPTILGPFSFSWRFMPYFFGMGLLMVVWLLAWRITKSWKAAFITLLICGTDSLLFVYSRIGLMDGIMYFFVFASFLACITALVQKKPWWQLGYLALAGVFAGVGMSVKWLGMSALILCFFWLLFHFKKILKPHGFIGISIAILLVAGVYLGSFIGEGNNWRQLANDTGYKQGSFFDNLWHWHEQAFTFNKNLKDTHPYGSTWWSWPLMLRPMLYYYEQVDPVTSQSARNIVTQEPLSTCVNDNTCLVRIIAALGNPIIWWSGFVSFLLTLVFIWPKNSWQWALTLSSIFMYLPWMFIGRVSFLYYFMGVAIVWQLLLALNLWQLAQTKIGKIIVPTMLILATIWFVMAYPVLTATPVNPSYVPLPLWFPSWRG